VWIHVLLAGHLVEGGGSGFAGFAPGAVAADLLIGQQAEPPQGEATPGRKDRRQLGEPNAQHTVSRAVFIGPEDLADGVNTVSHWHPVEPLENGAREIGSNTDDLLANGMGE